MEQETLQQFNKLEQGLGKLEQSISRQFKDVNGRIDKMSGFMMTNVALKDDLNALAAKLATKDDLQTVKTDIFNKVDSLAYNYKRLDEERVVMNSRLDKLEAKLE